MDRFGRDVRLGVDRLTHQFVIALDTPGGIIPTYLTAADLQQLGLEAIRITGRYSVFDFSEPIPRRQPQQRLPPTDQEIEEDLDLAMGMLPKQADPPK
jgi:hypothetical protein